VKGNISHAFKTIKITVFEPIMCKHPDAPLQDELLTLMNHLRTVIFNICMDGKMGTQSHTSHTLIL